MQNINTMSARTLAAGLRNGDFLPGAQRRAAQDRLTFLQGTVDRPRGRIVLNKH